MEYSVVSEQETITEKKTHFSHGKMIPTSAKHTVDLSKFTKDTSGPGVHNTEFSRAKPFGFADTISDDETTLKKFLSGNYSSVQDFSSEKRDAVKKSLSGNYSSVQDFPSEKRDAVKKSLSGNHSSVQDFSSEKRDAVKKFLLGNYSSVHDFSSEKRDAVKKSLSGNYFSIQDFSSEKPDPVKKSIILKSLNKMTCSIKMLALVTLGIQSLDAMKNIRPFQRQRRRLVEIEYVANVPMDLRQRRDEGSQKVAEVKAGDILLVDDTNGLNCRVVGINGNKISGWVSVALKDGVINLKKQDIKVMTTPGRETPQKSSKSNPRKKKKTVHYKVIKQTKKGFNDSILVREGELKNTNQKCRMEYGQEFDAVLSDNGKRLNVIRADKFEAIGGWVNSGPSYVQRC